MILRAFCSMNVWNFFFFFFFPLSSLTRLLWFSWICFLNVKGFVHILDRGFYVVPIFRMQPEAWSHTSSPSPHHFPESQAAYPCRSTLSSNVCKQYHKSHQNSHAGDHSLTTVIAWCFRQPALHLHMDLILIICRSLSIALVTTHWSQLQCYTGLNVRI